MESYHSFFFDWLGGGSGIKSFGEHVFYGISIRWLSYTSFCILGRDICVLSLVAVVVVFLEVLDVLMYPWLHVNDTVTH